MGLVVQNYKCSPYLHLAGATWVEFWHTSVPQKVWNFLW